MLFIDGFYQSEFAYIMVDIFPIVLNGETDA